MSRRATLLGSLLVLALAHGVAAQDAAEIVAKADLARRPGESFIWKATITSTEGPKAPSVNVYEVYVKGTGKSLVRFLAPARDVGRSLLALDRDLWIYLPEAGKPVRIPLSQRLVGQVANGDIARTNYAGDYTAKLVGTEAVDGQPCHVLDLTATAKDVTYAAIKYWVARDGLRPAKAEFFAGTGTLLKTGAFGGYRSHDGHVLATRLTLVDAIRKDRTSVIEFTDLRVRDLPDKLFNKNSMKSLD